jgi:hypothetical protein
MKIEHIHYFKDQSEQRYSIQWVSVESVIRLAKVMTTLKAEHVNWVGAVDNIFTQENTIYALVFYNGDWDSKEIVDRLISEANEPTSQSDWPTPFFYLLETVGSDRKRFVEKLKGDQII